MKCLVCGLPASGGIAECRRCGASLVPNQETSTLVEPRQVTARERNVELSLVLTVLLVADAAAVVLARFVPFLSLAHDVLFLATAVVFLVWLHRARRHVAPNQPQRWSPGWAVGAWFVPVFNLVVPVRIVLDIWRTDGRSNPSLKVLITAWWTCWLLAWLTGIRYVNQVGVDQNGFPFARSSLFASLGDTLLSAICTAAAAILLVVIVRRITVQQA